MKKVELIRSRLNPLAVDDVDTDQIIPARFLKTIERTGLGAHLFADWRGSRFDASDASARILLAGNNFGCGSSREHAVWALCDFGFAAVIATSFADIFRANALKNGLIPVEVDAHLQRFLVDARAADPQLTVRIDVRRATLTLPDALGPSGAAGGAERSELDEVPFPLDPFARRCITEGIDELEYLRRHEPAIAAWEKSHG
jgi:3-isopropylmalate/(R)-2-methylmalate dehydratase small subunit